MAPANKNDQRERHIVAVFGEVAPFRTVLDDLLDTGFSRSDVSILAPHADLEDHFDRKIPAVDELAERPDTPREDLEAEGALESAVRWLAESASVIGAAVAQGAAYAVGGPVGVATMTGAYVESTIEDVLNDYIDDRYTERFRETLLDGGLVCWVRAADRERARRAREILASHGGRDIHEVNLA